jgi:hypothetical protein
MGISPAGPRAVRVSRDGYVEVRLQDDERADLWAVVRICRETMRGGTGASWALERIMGITEQVLARYNEVVDEPGGAEKEK